MCRPRGQGGCSADGADAKEQNPTGLEMLASAQLDHPLDPTKRSSEIPVVWSRLPDCGAPDRCLVVSDAG